MMNAYLREKSDARYPRPLWRSLLPLVLFVAAFGVVAGTSIIYLDRTFTHNREVKKQLEAHTQLRVAQILADKQVLKMVCAR